MAVAQGPATTAPQRGGIPRASGLRIIVKPYELSLRNFVRGFPGGAVVETLPANAGDTGSSPGLGRAHMPRSD